MSDEPKKHLLRDIGQKLGGFARQVGDAVSRAASITDLTIRIKSRESERNRLLQQLGERLFTLTKQGQAPDILKVVGEDLFRDLERVEVELTTLREELRVAREKADKGEAGSSSKPAKTSIEPSSPPPSHQAESTRES